MKTRYPMLGYAFSIANGAKLPYRKDKNGRRYSPEAKHLLEEGMRPGVSDLMIPWPLKGYHGLFIEMKVEPNKTTEEQEDFIGQMNAVGYLAVVCYGCEAAIKVISDYMGIDLFEESGWFHA